MQNYCPWSLIFNFSMRALSVSYPRVCLALSLKCYPFLVLRMDNKFQGLFCNFKRSFTREPIECFSLVFQSHTLLLYSRVFIKQDAQGIMSLSMPVWVYTQFSLFNELIRQNSRERARQRCSVHLLSYSPNGLNSYCWVRPKPRVRTPSDLPHA